MERMPLSCPSSNQPVAIVVDPTRRLPPLLRSQADLRAVRIVDALPPRCYPTAAELLTHARPHGRIAMVLDLAAPAQAVWNLVVAVRRHDLGREIPILLTTQQRWRHGQLALSLGAIEVGAGGEGVRLLIERLAGVFADKPACLAAAPH